MASNPIRFLGIELAGAKSERTTLSTLEYYPDQEKLFLLDSFQRIGFDGNNPAKRVPTPRQTTPASDLELLEVIVESLPRVHSIGTYGALSWPPCTLCRRQACQKSRRNCKDPQVEWMRKFIESVSKRTDAETGGLKLREFVPYTQRAAELWVRYGIFPHLPEDLRFDIDETLGGNRAPINARMNFLQNRLPKVRWVEVHPKLSLAMLFSTLDVPKNLFLQYRKPDEGLHARIELVEAITEAFGVFVYERDAQQLASSLPIFDSWISALTAWFKYKKQTAPLPKGFDPKWGWINYPQLKKQVILKT